MQAPDAASCFLNIYPRRRSSNALKAAMGMPSGESNARVFAVSQERSAIPARKIYLISENFDLS
jgi:hypothetical protein